MANNYHEKEILIKPPTSLGHLNIRELYEYRYMMWSMVWRDIRLQFDNLYLGFFWASARPLLMLLVFIFFKRFSNANLYNAIPFNLYFYSGIILWYYFLEATTAVERSISKDANLIKKVYFPRIITPLVRVIACLYTLALAVIPLVIMMLWHSLYPDWKIILFPIVLLQCILLCLGVGIIFAALALTKRDYDRFLSLILYVGMFVSPVIYSPQMIPAKAHIFYFLNPMAGTLLAFRACLFHHFPFPFYQFLYSCLFSTVCLIIGMKIFKKAESYFADAL